MSTAIIKLETPRFAEVEVLDPETPRAPASPAEQLFSFGQLIATAVADQVIGQLKPVRLTDAEEAREWAKAWDEWLHTAPKTGDPRPPATIRAYGRAWTDFRQHCPKEARFVTSRDVASWVETLRTRLIDASVETGLIANGRRETGQAGLAARTVGQYIAAVSSFYSYVERYEAQTDAGQVLPLVSLDWRNPAKSHAVKRPKVQKFGQGVTWLSDAQLKAVKTTIRSAQTLTDLKNGVATRPTTVRELRDYALLLSYMLTGARNSEVRTWRWGDLEERGGTIYYTWANKGKGGTDELPRPCWEAVQDYLRLAGRLETIQDGDYIFQPSGDTILRLRRRDGTPVVDPAAWDANRPISPAEANRLLRRYCARAGIAAAEIHIHSLRHSANMLYAARGVPVEERSRMLHHSSLDMTQGYTHQLRGQQNPNWQKVADWLDA